MILACDPGLTGAFALLEDASLRVRDMPTFREAAGMRGAMRLFPDRPAIRGCLQTWFMLGCDVLVIEQVGGVPGQAAHGAFTFGHGAGYIEGAAEGIGYRVERVPPMRWKSAMKCPADKSKAIDRATEVFPAYANLWAPVRGNGSEAQRSGRAEAALLALYGQQTFGALS